jgi:pilus assembly protein Flp/PilA
MFGRCAQLVVDFLRKEDGPTAVEYAVMLALILAAIIAAVGNIGGTTSSMYNDLSLQGVKPL